MDIWRWVRETRTSLRAEGNARLADLLENAWKVGANGWPQTRQAKLSEALAGARALDNTWLDLIMSLSPTSPVSRVRDMAVFV